MMDGGNEAALVIVPSRDAQPAASDAQTWRKENGRFSCAVHSNTVESRERAAHTQRHVMRCVCSKRKVAESARVDNAGWTRIGRRRGRAIVEIYGSDAGRALAKDGPRGVCPGVFMPSHIGSLRTLMLPIMCH